MINNSFENFLIKNLSNKILPKRKKNINNGI